MSISAASPTPLILIIDDTPANLGVVVEHLKNHGFRLAVAEDGEEGL
jgi:CheY-like chemotaxis protein